MLLDSDVTKGRKRLRSQDLGESEIEHTAPITVESELVRMESLVEQGRSDEIDRSAMYILNNEASEKQDMLSERGREAYARLENQGATWKQ